MQHLKLKVYIFGNKQTKTVIALNVYGVRITRLIIKINAKMMLIIKGWKTNVFGCSNMNFIMIGHLLKKNPYNIH